MPEIHSVSPDRQSFLQIISTIESSVKSLWYIGKLPPARRPSIAIVGTRKPSPYGKEIAYKFSYELAKRGVIIVSGLALGIDGIVHQAALDAGGTTIAVLPTSLDAIYPFTHRGLATKILEQGGALLSEYPVGTRAHKGNFIARNRIVSGLSDALLIIEAAERSGTLATAGFALEQGKTVMAVPGNITSPMSVGCNNLIKHGASVATEVGDVLHELGIVDSQSHQLPLAYSEAEQKLIVLLAEGVRDGDMLQQRSNLSSAEFSQTLTILEIQGKVRALGANQWMLQ